MSDDPREDEVGVALFDLDRTLLDCNSGALWVRNEWGRGTLGMGDALLAGWWLFRYSLGHSGMEAAYRRAVSRLEGIEEQEMVSRTRRWFDQEVRHRVRPGGRSTLERHRAAGDRCILATSSSAYVAEVATEVYGLDGFVATLFEVEGGVFTGSVASLAYGAAKADRVQEWADREGIDLSQAVFYTDSATDLALLERVGKPVAVNPDRRLARIAAERGWETVDWGMEG